MDKQNIVYTYDGTSFSLKKDILTYATIQINLEDIMFTEYMFAGVYETGA